MIPFFEVPQERKKNYYIFSDKKKSQNASFISTPEYFSISSPQKEQKQASEHKGSGLKLPSQNNVTMYTDFSANSIQKIPELDSESSKVVTSVHLTKSLEKSDFSMNMSMLKAIQDTSHLHSSDADHDHNSFFIKKNEYILEDAEHKKKNSRRNSQLETIYNSLSYAAPLPFGCPEMPNLDSSNFDHIDQLDNPPQITLYSFTAWCCLFAGTVPELPRTLIQSKVSKKFTLIILKELPTKYKAVKDLYIRTPKKIDLINACFHEFIREGLIDLANSKEAQRIVKLYENGKLLQRDSNHQLCQNWSTKFPIYRNQRTSSS
jgi:hypothetical protein